MNFLRSLILKNLDLTRVFLAILVFFYSVYIIQYHYDGHHIGLMYSNAIDLNNGKLPYKEIFIQYGILTTFIHSIILNIFDNKIFFISLSTIIFYIFSILLISETVKNLVNKKYGLLCFFLLISNHPIPWLPWSNYLAFFFISLSLFLLSKKNKYNYFVGFFFSTAVLCRQDFFISIISSLILFAFFYYFFKKKPNINILKVSLGFITPLLLFIYYINSEDIYSEWMSYHYLPKFYMEIYNVGIIDLIVKFITFFVSEAFFRFVTTPQYFLISLILISNTFFILMNIFNKLHVDRNIFYISLLSLCLSLLGLKIELFRLYTSVTIGLIPLLFYIHKVTNKDLKKKLLLVLILPSFFSIIFYPLGNNLFFTKIDFNTKSISHSMSQFKFKKWSSSKIKSLNKINDITRQCNTQYLENLTFDSIFSTVGNFDRVRLLPFVKNNMKDSKFHQYIDKIKNDKKNFVYLINEEIIKENIIILINENNYSFNDKTIKFTPNYTSKEINISSIKGKPDILRVYFPKRCNN